jgi:hypothetical protein
MGQVEAESEPSFDYLIGAEIRHATTSARRSRRVDHKDIPRPKVGQCLGQFWPISLGPRGFFPINLHGLDGV